MSKCFTIVLLGNIESAPQAQSNIVANISKPSIQPCQELLCFLKVSKLNIAIDKLCKNFKRITWIHAGPQY